MHRKPDSDFSASVRPYFRQRAVYRIVTCAAYLVLLVSYRTWAVVPAVVIAVLASVKVARIESAMESKVWSRFARQLDSIDPQSNDNLAGPLQGVLGQLGDRRSCSVIVSGTYRGYPIRLLHETTEYNPGVKSSYMRDYRILEITAKQDFYHVFIDSKSNSRFGFSTAMNVLSLSVRGNQKLDVGGDAGKYFTIYVPPDDRYRSLLTLTPQKIMALRGFGTGFDVEFVGNKIFIITRDTIRNIKDALLYQDDVLGMLDNIGIDLRKVHNDALGEDLQVIRPHVLTF
jgi:hypothetical protein